MDRKIQEQFLFGNILLLANRLQLVGDSLTKEITLKQFLLLIMIKNMPSTTPSVSEIADFTGNTRQNTKKMLESLEKKAYVSMSKSKSDSRALSVSLTEKTIKYFIENENLGNILLDKVFKNVDDKTLVTTLNLMEQVLNNLSAIKNN